MSAGEVNSNVIRFFESIEKYYECKTEVTEGLYNDTAGFDMHFATWNLSEFILLRSAYRNNGERFMLEGETIYYEIAAARIVGFRQPGRNSFEFTEQYGSDVFRITKIRFHYKY